MTIHEEGRCDRKPHILFLCHLWFLSYLLLICGLILIHYIHFQWHSFLHGNKKNWMNLIWYIFHRLQNKWTRLPILVSLLSRSPFSDITFCIGSWFLKRIRQIHGKLWNTLVTFSGLLYNFIPKSSSSEVSYLSLHIIYPQTLFLCSSESKPAPWNTVRLVSE